MAGDIGSSEAVGSVGGKGRAIACTAACSGSSRPFFISTRSNAIPTVELGESLLCALASVTWPTIFVFLGITIWPCWSRSIEVRASILSFALLFLASSDFDNSTETTVPAANLSDAAARACRRLRGGRGRAGLGTSSRCFRSGRRGTSLRASRRRFRDRRSRAGLHALCRRRSLGLRRSLHRGRSSEKQYCEH